MSPAITIAGLSDFREIGRGGFAVVYRAHQDNVARPVAVKVLASLDLDADQQHRFRQECRTMGALSGHPNIVQVFDTGTTDQGHAYIVMELMVGGSLWQQVKTHGPVPADAILAIGVEMCGALESAHRRGILHRDVKPENILIDASGTARLADFGIATTTSGTRSITGAFAGTIAYLPPELVNGDKATVQADIYALGATLYALASARAPFVRATDQTPVSAIARILHDEPDDLGPLGIPGPLTAVIATAMAKNPANRYPTANAMGDALRSAQQQLGQPQSRLVIIEPPQLVGDPNDTIRRTPPPHAMGPTAALGATYDDDATVIRPASAPQPAHPSQPTKRSGLVIAAAVTVVALIAAAAAAVAWNLTSNTTSAARPTTVASAVTATNPATTPTNPPVTTTPSTTATAAPSTTVPSTTTSTAPVVAVVPEPLAIIVSRSYATALASHDWSQARTLNPTLPSDATLDAGYRYLNEQLVVDASTAPGADNKTDVRLLVLAHESPPAGDQTSFWCFHWRVDNLAQTIRSIDGQRLQTYPGLLAVSATPPALVDSCQNLGLK